MLDERPNIKLPSRWTACIVETWLKAIRKERPKYECRIISFHWCQRLNIIFGSFNTSELTDNDNLLPTIKPGARNLSLWMTFPHPMLRHTVHLCICCNRPPDCGGAFLLKLTSSHHWLPPHCFEKAIEKMIIIITAFLMKSLILTNIFYLTNCADIYCCVFSVFHYFLSPQDVPAVPDRTRRSGTRAPLRSPAGRWTAALPACGSELWSPPQTTSRLLTRRVWDIYNSDNDLYAHVVLQDPTCSSCS